MATTFAAPAVAEASTARAIAYRTAGSRHGPITRLMSPGDLGELLKPFVFLDLFEADSMPGRGFPPHPHSGIATLTLFLEGAMNYADTTGKSGRLSAGAVEWMRAGSAVWHAGEPVGDGAMRGYQLWLALPPELELAPAESLYLEPGRIEGDDRVRVILGTYKGRVSPIPLPVPITYLHVRLKDGEHWTYTPASGHGLAWLALNRGKLQVANTVLERELAMFADGDAPIEMVAQGDVELVVGSAARSPHPLVTGYYSVHTNPAARAAGERNIAELERTPAVAALRAR